MAFDAVHITLLVTPWQFGQRSRHETERTCVVFVHEGRSLNYRPAIPRLRRRSVVSAWPAIWTRAWSHSETRR